MSETSTFKLEWDPAGERYYEMGCDRGVLFPMVNSTYPAGVAWNGLISVAKKPSGAEFTPLYANNRKYVNLQSAENFGCTIEAYTYPEEFEACNGKKTVVAGLSVGQQSRSAFGLAYRNFIGNDEEGNKAAYRISLIYGAKASPAEETDSTINDDPEAKTMSWECETTPVDMAGFEPTSILEIDSRTVDAEKLLAFEKILYGSGDADARLPLPDEVAELLGYEGPTAG